MKLTKKQTILVSFMLFSLFFGAGNLIFPPFLGQSAGSHTPIAIATFLITAVALPVLGVIVVAKFGGLEKLAGRVHPTFAIVFTVLIYLSIGPGLGIPRAASVPFEMAVAPYLGEGVNLKLYMVIYSFVFFSLATWLCLTPNKLVERIGKFLTPTLLILMIFLFVSFVSQGFGQVGNPLGDYQTQPAVVGFLEGYNTMDTIAALNFGLVISTTIQLFGITRHQDILKTTVKTGCFAGIILSLIYLMLAYLGMQASGLYPIQENGAWTLRYIVYDLFGENGAFLLAAIFTLACLTTCVGLITSISQYFTRLLKKVKYEQFVIFISVFSFLVCNLGLNTILSISVPVLNAIYPISIVLIVMGLMDDKIKHCPLAYPVTILFVGIVSVSYALKQIGFSFALLDACLEHLPLYSVGLGWSSIALLLIIISYGYSYFKNERKIAE